MMIEHLPVAGASAILDIDVCLCPSAVMDSGRFVARMAGHSLPRFSLLNDTASQYLWALAGGWCCTSHSEANARWEMLYHVGPAMPAQSLSFSLVFLMAASLLC